DIYNNITESNETNNNLNQTVNVNPVPDLVPLSIIPPNNPYTGVATTVTTYIKNKGTADAGTFTVKLLDNGAGIGWITVDNLAVGTTTGVTFNWTPTTTGTHVLQVIADIYNNITESNETNNNLNQSINIT
ncbi:MAG: CARDB domain-containing protein, partial [Methanobacteriaceae archaeon]|nr:CARDB domain-containing protein [Methanobacteriaceae archaeon]